MMRRPDSGKARRVRLGAAAALFALWILSGSEVPAVAAAVPDAPAALELPPTSMDPERRIVHVLNRLAFGPRPGDVSRVRRVGVAAYIERQLRPEAIEDPDLERRLAPLTTLSMTTAERLVAFPPRQLILAVGRQLGSQLSDDERRRRLPELGPDDSRETRADRKAARTTDPRELAVRRERQEAPGPRVISDELAQARLIRAIYGRRQLEEVLTDFWFNHFNVDVGKGAVRWWATDYEQSAIRPHVLGRFRDLLGAVARHPAMLFYLDNWLSSSTDGGIDARTMNYHAIDGIHDQGLPPGGLGPLLLRRRGMDTADLERRIARRDSRSRLSRAQRGESMSAGEPLPGRSGLNENYARELLELHTLGVDGGYTQQDIVEVARCFTGWSLLPLYAGQGFVYIEELHDHGDKTVLGQRIEARGRAEGEAVLDLVARHPATARFISTKLARRFVGDDPPAALVGRLARTFAETDGDLRAVLRTLFVSPEFWAPEAWKAKVKTPFEYVVSAVRATAAEVRVAPGRSPVAPAAPVDAMPDRTADPTGAEAAGDTAAALTDGTNAALTDDTAAALTDGTNAALTEELSDATTGAMTESAGDDRADAMVGIAGASPASVGAQGLVRRLHGMGQPLYGCRPPTGYADRAEAWVSAGALLHRMRFAMGLAANRLRGIETDVAAGLAQRRVDGDALTALAWRLTGEYPAPETLAAIRDPLDLSAAELKELGLPARFGRSPRGPARLAAGWILAAGEFQRR